MHANYTHRHRPLSKAELQQNKIKTRIRGRTHTSRARQGKKTANLEPEVPDLLPDGQRAVRSALGLHLLVQVELAAPGIDVDAVKMDTEFEGAAVDLVADEEEDDDGTGKVVLEEALGVEVRAADRL